MTGRQDLYRFIFMTAFQQNQFFRGIKTVMTIHNLKFQGVWDVKTIKEITGLSDYYFAPDKLEAYKDGNFLKGGIVFADAITTVSNTYAEEIKTPFYGERSGWSAPCKGQQPARYCKWY